LSDVLNLIYSNVVIEILQLN